MQRTERRLTWHRPALAVSFAVFLVLTFTSSPSVSSIPTLSDLETLPLPSTLLPEPASSPAPSSGHEAQRLYLESLPYGTAIVEVSTRTGVDGLLIASVVEMESGFAANVVSPRGAVGLMQVRPGGTPKSPDLTDPKANLEAGSRYLASLLDRYDGDLERALAAYNAGPGMVDRWKGVPPFRETRSYVRRVQERYLGLHRRLWHGDSDSLPHAEIAEALAAITR
ncbi:MAG TPA: lytic transglycosylase domain-containing protein [Thermoanaerobaculia bacterium]|nr:lytic transglycosylase domain-containing protein [Thermoanaerobaculia bacterium]